MKAPFTDWSCGSQRFKEHEKSEIQKTALLTMQSFSGVMHNTIKPINQIHDEILDQTISKNRKILSSIVETVILNGTRNIPFRGHRDDSSQYSTQDCGNFQALLDFRVRSGDQVLADHFKNAPRNATYRSKTTQNELISCCAQILNKKIIKEIKVSRFFSILADEVTDCSNKEQMPLVIRYVDGNGDIQERFLRFIECDTGVTGKALSDKILSCLDELGLDLNNCRGQCYDGAANMAGKCKGVASRILALNDLALYTHCASHRLNLCVAASCQIQIVRNMMNNVQVISRFFNKSPKRQALLEKMVAEHLPGYNHTKLIDVCQTRWVLRIVGLTRFIEMYPTISEALFTIRDNSDGNWDGGAADSYDLASVCCNFDFIITLVTVRMCLEYTRSATVQLQTSDLDIIQGLKEIDIMKKSISKVRELIDGYHKVWFEKACRIANQVDAAIKAPRICKRQQHRNNIPVDDVESYFKINVALPLLDHLSTELSNRFSERNCIAFKAISLLPSIMNEQYKGASIAGVKRTHDDALEKRKEVLDDAKVLIQRVDKPWKEDLLNFCIQYQQDMPNIATLSHEVDNWESKWANLENESIPSSISDTIRVTNPISFPNISTALKILAVLPVTSCTCERSASSIRLLKTYLRSTMSQERLNGLASLFTHRDIEIDVQKVIDLYSVKHKRKLALGNILESDQNPEMNDELITSEVY